MNLADSCARQVTPEHEEGRCREPEPRGITPNRCGLSPPQAPDYRHGEVLSRTQALEIDSANHSGLVASELLLYLSIATCRSECAVRLPFTSEAFVDVLAAYNTTLWPAVVALWVASALACAWLMSSSRRSHDRWVSGLLALHWAWSAIAYHMTFFTRINPAAWPFAVLFLVQAALFVWSGLIKGDLSFRSSGTTWTFVGWALMLSALLYPAITVVEHGSVVRAPTFGLPCPTTIFTAGVLMLTSSPRRSLAIVPIVWSAIGGSAAFLLGVSADYALPVAGAALALFALQKPKTFSLSATSSLRSSVVR